MKTRTNASTHLFVARSVVVQHVELRVSLQHLRHFRQSAHCVFASLREFYIRIFHSRSLCKGGYIKNTIIHKLSFHLDAQIEINIHGRKYCKYCINLQFNS